MESKTLRLHWICFHCLRPVSYTHLDMQLLQVELSKEIPDTYTVYNQDYGHKTNIHPAAKKLLGQRAANLALEKIYGIEAVSYTHLDVYKRQGRH